MSSKIKEYKREILKLEIQIEEEKSNRLKYSLKGDSASLSNSIEKEGRLKSKIRELEYKIYELEAPMLRIEAEKRNKNKSKSINEDINKSKKSSSNKSNLSKGKSSKKSSSNKSNLSKGKSSKKSSSNKSNSSKNNEAEKVSYLQLQLTKIKFKKINNKSDFKEEYSVILDYLPYGYLNKNRSKFDGKPIIQAIGINNFQLLELAPKNGVDFEIDEVVYIGKGKRDKIYRVLGKLDVTNLTSTSIFELEYVISNIVEANQEKFVDYFNNAGSISLNLHGLGLIPDINRRDVTNILKERNKKPFESFDDIEKRVNGVKDPKSKVVRKVLEELGILQSKRKNNIYIFINPSRVQKRRK